MEFKEAGLGSLMATQELQTDDALNSILPALPAFLLQMVHHR